MRPAIPVLVLVLFGCQPLEEGLEPDDVLLADGGLELWETEQDIDVEPEDEEDPPEGEDGPGPPPTIDRLGSTFTGLDPTPDTCPFVAGAEPQKKAIFTTTPPDADFAIENELIRMLRAAVPGSRVRISVFTFTRTYVANEIIDAYERGVDVRLILDERNQVEAPRGSGRWRLRESVRRMRASLGADRVILCNEDIPPNGGACLGSGINHNKLFLFSELCDGSTHVVAQSSANLTFAQLRNRNNMVVIRNDRALFEAYEGYFDDLGTQRRDLAYYHSEIGDTGAKAYFFPRAGHGPASDTMHLILTRNVDCSRGGQIRVAMAFWTAARSYLVDDLAELADQGCSVRVIVSENASTPALQRHLRRTLGADVILAQHVHHKYILVDAVYGGERRELVWTGSHNYTGPALRRNDETLLKIQDPAVYEAFRESWEALWDELS